MPSNKIRRTVWVAFGFATLLLLAACGRAITGENATAEVPAPVAEPVPTATVEAAPLETAKATIEATATELEPTATLDVEENEGDDPKVVDDRPDRLRFATSSWNTNWAKRAIDYDELLSGGPPRDGIPSIDDPKFISPVKARAWLADNEPVISLEIDGDARAYPLQILTWHEIVNDRVGDVPVLVTFCPLCNSAITFDRRVDDVVYEFGTSGLLRNSDLVMYDRTTESLWQQLTGEAIIGDMLGSRLDFLSSSIVSFADFRQAYPEGIILSQDTGYSRAYGTNPYTGYDRVGQTPFLFSGEIDGRLQAMARVVTVSLVDGSGQEMDLAYPVSVLSEVGAINDAQAGRDLAILHASGTSSALDSSVIANGVDVGATGVYDAHLDGRKLTFYREGDKLVDDETGSTWNVLGQAIDGPLAGKSLEPVVHGDHFWFAWAAFKPDTLVYQSDA